MIPVGSTQTNNSPASSTPASNSPEKFGFLDSIDSSDNAIGSHELFVEFASKIVHYEIRNCYLNFKNMICLFPRPFESFGIKDIGNHIRRAHMRVSTLG